MLRSHSASMSWNRLVLSSFITVLRKMELVLVGLLILIISIMCNISGDLLSICEQYSHPFTGLAELIVELARADMKEDARYLLTRVRFV